MERSTPVGASQSPASQSGDIDANGDLVDELTRRLREAIPAESGVWRHEQAERVAGVVIAARRRAAGAR